MAEVRYTPQKVLVGGLAATYNSPSVTDTYKIRNNGRVVLHCKKSGAGACNVTIVTPHTVDGNAVSDRVVSIPATTGDKFVGPFKTDVYNDNNDITVTFSEITGLTVAILQL